MIIYVTVINMIGFAMMGIDKSRAKKGEWRIPEKTLFACALLGGSLGTTCGMHVFHHKTKHWYFKYGMPLILVLQVYLINGIIK
ncbi:MAG: DUF1294 domain-containing protein [Roseburia sp.]|nr:DUF1294 domain-containing protein [Roseburia sp.]